MRSWKWMFSYITAASLGLWLALAVSIKFVRPAHSQTPSASAPSNGDLPPEFMAETAGTPAPASPTPAAQPNSAATPAPATSATPSANRGGNNAGGTDSTGTQGSANAAGSSANATGGSARPSTGNSGSSASGASGTNAQQGNPSSGSGSQGLPPGTTTTPPMEPEAVTAPSPRLGADDYVYDPTGRRDPFKPYKTILSGVPAKPPPQQSNNGPAREQIPTDPLQRWDVDRFKVIGILWEVRAPKAMIKDPDGTMYTIMKNTKIGRYNGYVAAIREGEIVIIESYENDGKMQKETKVLELGK